MPNPLLFNTGKSVQETFTLYDADEPEYAQRAGNHAGTHVLCADVEYSTGCRLTQKEISDIVFRAYTKQLEYRNAAREKVYRVWAKNAPANTTVQDRERAERILVTHEALLPRILKLYQQLQVKGVMARYWMPPSL